MSNRVVSDALDYATSRSPVESSRPSLLITVIDRRLYTILGPFLYAIVRARKKHPMSSLSRFKFNIHPGL